MSTNEASFYSALELLKREADTFSHQLVAAYSQCRTPKGKDIIEQIETNFHKLVIDKLHDVSHDFSEGCVS